MVELDLNEDEQATLQGILESYLSDLRMEIADTDLLAFRDILKVRKAVLTKVIDVLAKRPAA